MRHRVSVEVGRPYGVAAGDWWRWVCSCHVRGPWTRPAYCARIGGGNHTARTPARYEEHW